MVKLVPYDTSFEAITLYRISDFFGFHGALVQKTDLESERLAVTDESLATLAEWQIPPNALFVIVCEDVSVGFIRINSRGPNVAWIEDVFVDAAFRGRGIASSAIAAVETIIMNTPGYTAVCLDVSPRNEAALRLYHKLGYVDLSLLTLRKEFDSSKRDRQIRILGLDFKF